MRAKIFRVEIVEHDFVENTRIIRGIVQSQTQTYLATALREFLFQGRVIPDPEVTARN